MDMEFQALACEKLEPTSTLPLGIGTKPLLRPLLLRTDGALSDSRQTTHVPCRRSAPCSRLQMSFQQLAEHFFSFFISS